MIAQRFKAVGWVAMVAIAATLLYLISLQVAVERGKLEAVEKQIAAAQREVRQLQTEMGTRASMRQLERWNGLFLVRLVCGRGGNEPVLQCLAAGNFVFGLLLCLVPIHAHPFQRGVKFIRVGDFLRIQNRALRESGIIRPHLPPEGRIAQ